MWGGHSSLHRERETIVTDNRQGRQRTLEVINLQDLTESGFFLHLWKRHIKSLSIVYLIDQKGAKKQNLFLGLTCTLRPVWRTLSPRHLFNLPLPPALWWFPFIFKSYETCFRCVICKVQIKHSKHLSENEDSHGGQSPPLNMKVSRVVRWQSATCRYISHYEVWTLLWSVQFLGTWRRFVWQGYKQKFS